ncbi:hypothetical protein FHX57_004241 [Paraburkholderia tropica]|nr:hypothetical protein [Paraburkholderia tropica]MBB3001883.1 hypothetical protein [Paraburkholderia tropica]MBB6321266.1 hypothetical protein [Paraburkholderia tropica]
MANAEAILNSLLSEADFFVDEKDLQTFVGAAIGCAFFLPANKQRDIAPRLQSLRERPTALLPLSFRRLGLQTPVFHYIVPGVHRGTQQVLPVIAVPGTIRLELAGGGLIGTVDFHEPMNPTSQCRQHDDLPLHANGIHHEFNVLPEQPVKTLTFDTNCYTSGNFPWN